MQSQVDQAVDEIVFPDMAQVLMTAEMQRRMDEAEERVRLEKLAKANDADSAKDDGKTGEKPRAVSPRNGQPVPQAPGRAPGVKNKLTNLRDAVLEAFDQVGGAAYLAQLAQGNSSDRAAFVGLVSKVLPTQVNANVEGGVQIQLSWLGSRSIGTTMAQNPEQITQVVDLQKDSAGKYRIIDQVSDVSPAAAGGGGGSEAGKAAGDAQDA